MIITEILYDVFSEDLEDHEKLPIYGSGIKYIRNGNKFQRVVPGGKMPLSSKVGRQCYITAGPILTVHLGGPRE